MSLILGNGNLISVDNIDNLLNLEQRNKNKYDMQDAVYNESKSNSDNNDDNNNNYNDNSKHDNDGNGNGNNNSKYDANNVDDNHNYDNSNKEDEIVSFMSITVVKNILNSVSFYNNPVRNVLDNYDVNYESEWLGLMNIRIETSQNLNFVEYDMFYQSENSILECSKLSENIQNEHNIPFNSKYIKSESNVADIITKAGPSKVNKFELEFEYIKFEYIVNKPALRAAVKFKKPHLL